MVINHVSKSWDNPSSKWFKYVAGFFTPKNLSDEARGSRLVHVFVDGGVLQKKQCHQMESHWGF